MIREWTTEGAYYSRIDGLLKCSNEERPPGKGITDHGSYRFLTAHCDWCNKQEILDHPPGDDLFLPFRVLLNWIGNYLMEPDTFHYCSRKCRHAHMHEDDR